MTLSRETSRFTICLLERVWNISYWSYPITQNLPYPFRSSPKRPKTSRETRSQFQRLATDEPHRAARRARTSCILSPKGIQRAVFHRNLNACYPPLCFAPPRAPSKTPANSRLSRPVAHTRAEKSFHPQLLPPQSKIINPQTIRNPNLIRERSEAPGPPTHNPQPQSHARNRRPPTHHQPCPSPTPMEGDARHRQGLSTSHRAGRSLRRGAEPGGRGRCDRHPWLQRQARIRLAWRRAEQQQKSHGWDFCSGPAGPVRGAQAAAKPRPTPTTDPAHP